MTMKSFFKVYMTDFFICSIKSPPCTDKNSKKKIRGQFSFHSRVLHLMYQKREISLLVAQHTFVPFLCEFISSQ